MSFLDCILNFNFAWWLCKMLTWLQSQVYKTMSACVLSRFSCVWLFVTLMTVALQAPLSMRILQARILEWVAMPTSDLPDPGIEPESLISPALAGGFLTTSATWEAHRLKNVWLLCHLPYREHWSIKNLCYNFCNICMLHKKFYVT